MRSRSRFRGSARGPRRGVEWISGGFSGAGALFTSLAAATNVAGYIVAPSVARLYTNSTLVRTRGLLVVRPAVVSGVTSNILGAAGIIAWADRDDAAPAAAEAPRPWTDPDLDWIWHGYLILGGGTLNAESYSDVRLEIDSKAMRKLGADEGVLLCLQNNSTVQPFDYAAGVRCLIKE